MQIHFLGHACFLLEDGANRVVTDPFSPQIGYAPVDVEANVVTLSHDNPKWHSCLDDVRGEFQLFRGLEHIGKTTRIRDLTLEAIRVWEISSDGSAEGDTELAMVKVTFSDGTRVLHMGDVGHALTDEQICSCGEVDVLLALAGGFPTLSLEKLIEFAQKLKPKIVIPMHFMHFAIPNLAMNLLPVDDLVKLWPARVVQHENSFLDGANLPGETELHVLKPARI